MTRPLSSHLEAPVGVSPGDNIGSDAGRLEEWLRAALSKESGTLEIAYRVLAEELTKAGKHEQAAAAFDALISAQPDDVRGYIGAANAKMQLDKPAEAAKLWRVVRERFPSAYSTREMRKHAQSLLRAEALDEAGELFLRLHKMKPKLPHGTVGLAKIAERSRQWDAAVRLWEECLDRYADKAEPLWTEALERCRLKARGDVRLAPRSETTARSDSAKAYFRLMSKAENLDHLPAPAFNFRSVLVVSYGRSGSTLLQGMLNSIDGVLVRGENANVFFKLFGAFEAFTQAASKHRRATAPNAPWFGVGQADLEQLLEDFRRVARSIVLSDRSDDARVACFGFKEIRYDVVGDRLPKYLKFLERVFPEPAFLFLTRDLNDVVRSGWWKELDPEEVRSSLSATEERFAAFAEGRHNCFQLTYEDMVGRSDRLRAMFDFLGVPYRPEILDIVMATPHSYDPGQDSVRRLFWE